MQKIPKVIHYCWFGKGTKGKLIEKCISSRHKNLKDFKIIERNEDNFDITSSSFAKRAYENKKRAFVSDYARLSILYKQGGVYLDTDMEILKPLNEFLEHDFFLGYEKDNIISAGIIGATAGNKLVELCLKDYDDGNKEYISIPEMIAYTRNKNKQSFSSGVKFYPSEYFYPYYYTEKFHPKCIKSTTHGIHWRDNSRNKGGNKYMYNFKQLILKLDIFRMRKIIIRLIRYLHRPK